ncbi:hypothetical protein ACVW00_002636 [Marmoricola sp. URHA0025 HA25]
MPARRRASSARSREDGAVAVLVALCAVALFVIAALVVDLGLARDTRRQSQNAADAAALAAVNVLYPTSGKCSDGTSTPSSGCKPDAAAAAKQYAEANFDLTAADWATCDTPPTGFTSVPTYPTCISIDAIGRHVWVNLPARHVKTGLGNSAGISDVPVASGARATVTVGALSNCGLCMLGANMTHTIQNGNITVAGTSVQANGNLSTANNGAVAVTGGSVQVQGTAAGNISPAATTGSPTLVDPLAGVQLPSAANSWFNVPAGLKASICTQGPGFYQSPTIGNNCVLQPGLYVITGDLHLSGQNSINATAGVTLYFACGTSPAPTPCASGGQAGGSMTYTGQATLSIHPPTTGPMKGFSIVADRNNTSDIELKGNGAGSVTGTIDAASAVLGFRGNGAGAMDSLVVVKDVDFRGNPSTMSLVYTGSNNADLPPSDPALDR